MSVGPAPGLSIGTSVGLGSETLLEPSSSSSSSSQPQQPPSAHYDAVVAGGGPAGLLAAIMLARHLPPSPTPRIVVFDRLPPPPPPDSAVYAADVSKYYLLGLGHRGQSALRALDAWHDVEEASVAVVGRRDWAPGKSGEDESTVRLADKKVTSRVVARDKLVGVLRGVVAREYGDVVELKYGWQVDPVSFGNENEEEQEENGTMPPMVELRVSRCVPVDENAEECRVDDEPRTITAGFLVGADGAARTIANRMEENDVQRRQRRGRFATISKRLFGGACDTEMPFRVTRYDDDNPRVYKSVPLSFPSHWPHDLNYSARSKDGRVTFEALPSDDKGTYCALLLMRPHDPLAAAQCDPQVLREFLDEEFPQFSALLSDEVVSDVAAKGASALPGFRYAGPRLHEGGRTVLLGDCAHTVKPYFGLGANTALEDVHILAEILAGASNSSSNSDEFARNLPGAVREYTRRRGADAKALVTISRGMDRPGKLGTMRFVVPLIVDGMFHKLAPSVFAPGMFGMFQLEGVGFREIQWRKRRDRALQSLVIASAATVMGVGVKRAVKGMARLLGVSDLVVGGSAATLLAAAGVARRLAKSEA